MYPSCDKRVVGRIPTRPDNQTRSHRATVQVDALRSSTLLARKARRASSAASRVGWPPRRIRSVRPNTSAVAQQKYQLPCSGSVSRGHDRSICVPVAGLVHPHRLNTAELVAIDMPPDCCAWWEALRLQLEIIGCCR